MTVRLSDGLTAFLQNGGSFKEAFPDFCIEVYSGAQPASANAAPGALKIMRFTKDGNSWSLSVARKDSVTVGSHETGKHFTVSINSVDYTYIALAGDDTNDKVALALAALLNAAGVVKCITDGSGKILIAAKYAGTDYTIGVSSSDGGTINTASITANSRGNSLQFAAALSSLMLVKDSSNWQGAGLSGSAGSPVVAGWWRMKGDFTDDDSTSSVFKRMDGSCNTANSDLLALTTLNIVTGGIDNITSFNITQPQS